MCSSRLSRTSSFSSFEKPREENRTVNGRVNSFMLTDTVHVNTQINEQSTVVTNTLNLTCPFCVNKRETKKINEIVSHRQSKHSIVPNYPISGQSYFSTNVRRVEKQNQ